MMTADERAAILAGMKCVDDLDWSEITCPCGQSCRWWGADLEPMHEFLEAHQEHVTMQDLAQSVLEGSHDGKEWIPLPTISASDLAQHMPFALLDRGIIPVGGGSSLMANTTGYRFIRRREIKENQTNQTADAPDAGKLHAG